MAAPLRMSIESFLLVTYAVPVERVRPLLPSGLEPDTVPGPGGASLGLFSATYFHTRGLRLAALRYPALSYRQCTFRIYARRPDGTEGVFFLATYLEPPGFWAQRLITPDAHRGRFHTESRFTAGGGWSVSVQAPAGAEHLELAAEGPDAPPADPAFAEWITQRLHGWLRLTVGGYGEQEVGHPVLPVRTGVLRHARIDLFRRLGLLTDAEMGQPHAVHFVPAAPFTGETLRRSPLRSQ